MPKINLLPMFIHALPMMMGDFSEKHIKKECVYVYITLQMISMLHESMLRKKNK